jgi:hypothetical protein
MSSGSCTGAKESISDVIGIDGGGDENERLRWPGALSESATETSEPSTIQR